MYLRGKKIVSFTKLKHIKGRYHGQYQQDSGRKVSATIACQRVNEKIGDCPSRPSDIKPRENGSMCWDKNCSTQSARCKRSLCSPATMWCAFSRWRDETCMWAIDTAAKVTAAAKVQDQGGRLQKQCPRRPVAGCYHRTTLGDLIEVDDEHQRSARSTSTSVLAPVRGEEKQADRPGAHFVAFENATTTDPANAGLPPPLGGQESWKPRELYEDGEAWSLMSENKPA